MGSELRVLRELREELLKRNCGRHDRLLVDSETLIAWTVSGREAVAADRSA